MSLLGPNDPPFVKVIRDGAKVGPCICPKCNEGVYVLYFDPLNPKEAICAKCTEDADSNSEINPPRNSKASN